MNQSVMVSPDRPLMAVPFDQRLLTLFPAARRVGDHVILPHGPDETRVLRNLGFSAPAPIHSQYSWPGAAPFMAQRVTAAMLSVEPRAYVLNGLGTGKTRSVLYAFDFLRQTGKAKTMLVVAPLSTLNFTWRREVFSTFPHLKVVVLYHENAAKRRKLLDEPADIYVINPDGMKVLGRALEGRFDTWVFDELTAYRNARSARSKLAQKLTAKVPRVWGLTGTPMPKEPTDVFGQMRLIQPLTSPKSFTHFRQRVMTQVSQFKWLPRNDARDYVYEQMQPAVRFALQDCVDMPPVVEINREVKIGPDIRKVYDTMLKHLVVLREQHKITAANSGVLRNKLLQIASGFLYDDSGEATFFDDSDRYAILRDLLDQADRPALVFAPWRALVEYVYGRLKDDGYVVAKVLGGTSAKERNEAFAAVQAKNTSLQALVAHPGTMSHGLNLHGSDTVCWYAATDDAEIYEQANARVQRPGQAAEKTRLAHLFGMTSERVVLRRLRDRQSMQDALLEMFAT